MRLYTKYFILSVMICLTFGCIDFPLSSLNPIRTSKTTVFKEPLLGTWIEDNINDGSWTFKEGRDKNYILEGVTLNNGETEKTTLIAYLVKLGENYFLELSPDLDLINDKDLSVISLGFFPYHMIFKIVLKDNSFKMWFPEINESWLENISDDNPFSVVNNILGAGGIPIVNSKTEAVQAFLIKYGDDENLFPEDNITELRRYTPSKEGG